MLFPGYFIALLLPVAYTDYRRFITCGLKA